MSEKRKNQLIPIVLSVLVLAVVSSLYYISIQTLNLFPGEKIQTVVYIHDILVGLTIYLKTSVDFALLIGLLMKQFPGLKNRIAIETGTAFGNAFGTIAILVVWYFFKEIFWLLALMVLVASLVLFRLAQTSLEHNDSPDDEVDKNNFSTATHKVTTFIQNFIKPINKFTSPVLSKIIPDLSFNSSNINTLTALLIASFSIPFILGLDDFAGYVPLFNIVNVFGFGVGVFLGHSILNILLFIDPDLTIKAVKNPIIAILGSIVFISLGFWGLYEVLNIINIHYLHIGGIYSH